MHNIFIRTLSVCLTLCLAVCLAVCLAGCLSVCPACLSVRLWLSVCPCLAGHSFLTFDSCVTLLGRPQVRHGHIDESAAVPAVPAVLPAVHSRQAGRQTDRQADRQADMQADRQIDKRMSVTVQSLHLECRATADRGRPGGGDPDRCDHCRGGHCRLERLQSVHHGCRVQGPGAPTRGSAQHYARSVSVAVCLHVLASGW